MKIAALLLLAATAAAPPPKGTLCFGNSCKTVEGTKVEIAPSDSARQWVWTSEDAKTIAIGTATPKATRIDLGAKELVSVTMTIRGSASRGWPLDTRIGLETAPKQPMWEATIPAKVVAGPLTLRAPRGAYYIGFTAPHHGFALRRVQIDAALALHEFVLEPSPIVTGRVVTDGPKGDVPLAGVQLMRADGKVAGATNEQGAFRFELAGPPMQHLIVMHPGFGSKTIPLAPSRDVNLGTIRLTVGHELTIKISRPQDLDEPIHLAVGERTNYQTKDVEVFSRDLKVADRQVAVPDLANGKYAVTLTGRDALEHLEAVVDLKDDDVEHTFAISPYRLDGTAKIGDRPIDTGVVGFNSRNGWQAEMPIRDGHFGAVVWQAGVMSGWLKTGEAASIPVTSPELGANPSTWDITVPDRRIAGRIFDADTNQPIDRAQLEVQITTSGGKEHRFRTGRFPAHVDADGRYSQIAFEDGTYELRVSAPGHLNDSAAMTVAPDDKGTVTRDFALGRGIETPIDVVTPNGLPVERAQIFEGINSDGHNAVFYYSTDDNGRLVLRMRENETKTLYIVPRQGSFAVAHVTAPREGKPLQIVIAPPAGGLTVNPKWPDGKRVPSATVLRYNGELLPQPMSLRIDWHRLPAGTYEIWTFILPPGTNYERMIGFVPATPGVSVGVTGGETVLDVVPTPLP